MNLRARVNGVPLLGNRARKHVLVAPIRGNQISEIVRDDATAAFGTLFGVG